MYLDCDIVEGAFPIDDTGHPLSTFKIKNHHQPFVFLRWMEGKDIVCLRIHEEWVSIRYPIMLCGEKNCINPEHMIFGRRDLTGVPNDNEESCKPAFERQQLKRGYIMDQSDLRKSISEMTDEELHELIRGTRDSRREGPAKKRAAAKKRQSKSKVKDVAEEFASLFASLSEEEKIELLSQLEEEDEDGADN